jgi:hypothetical protein
VENSAASDAGVPLARLIFAVTFYAAFGTYGAMMLRTNK